MSETVINYQEAEDILRDIIERFRESPLSTTETYSFFELDDDESVQKRNEQKSLFLEGEIRNPQLNFPKLERPETIEGITKEESKILGLMAASMDLAHDPDREAVLYDLLRIRQLEMVMLLRAKDLCGPQLDLRQLSETAAFYNQENDQINGPIDPGFFNGLLSKHQKRAQHLLAADGTPEEVKRAATYFIENTGQIPEDAPITRPVRPKPEPLELLRTYLEGKFSDILECVPDKPDDEKFTAEEVADIFRKAHEVRETGWDTRIQAGKTGIDTRQNEETTVVGADRQRSARNVRGILVHENGIHVQRRVNGDKSGDPLLAGLGLPWYLASEEGLTAVCQQAIEGKTKESGEQYYLAIGLTRGLDGKPRDFRDAYELELARRIMSEHVDKDDDIDEEDKLRSQSYTTILRVRRGTRAEVPGVAFTKDLVYYHGDQVMWKTMLRMLNLPEEHRDQMFDLLLAAKYDPHNEQHLKMVKQALG